MFGHVATRKDPLIAAGTRTRSSVTISPAPSVTVPLASPLPIALATIKQVPGARRVTLYLPKLSVWTTTVVLFG